MSIKKIMESLHMYHLLFGFFMLVLFTVILYNNLIIYWIATNTGQLNIYQQKSKTNEDYVDDQLSTLNTIKRNEKSSLPWYFKNGTIRPNKTQINPNTRLGNLQVWLERQPNGVSDRVEEQLMFVPPNYQYENAAVKKILLYYGLVGWFINDGQSVFVSNDCPVNRCEIVSDNSEAPNVDAILFRGSFSPPNHKKPKKQVWILYFLESPYHTQLIEYNDVFNWTATYRHDSDIVTPYERWAYYDPSVTQVKRTDRNYALNKTKLVAWFVSNCRDKNGRLQYARELAKYIPVDVYGSCGNLVCHRSDFKCFQMLEQDYKFYLAFENSNCVDYVTEKFFVNGLGHNVLPIVMGGRREDYERMAPKRSYLHVDDYESPERLAEHLYRLNANDGLYNEYFRWKGTGEFIDTKFFCRLCAMLHDDSAPAKHYRNVNDWWRGPGVCKNEKRHTRRIRSPPPLDENTNENNDHSYPSTVIYV